MAADASYMSKLILNVIHFNQLLLLDILLRCLLLLIYNLIAFSFKIEWIHFFCYLMDHRYFIILERTIATWIEWVFVIEDTILLPLLIFVEKRLNSVSILCWLRWLGWILLSHNSFLKGNVAWVRSLKINKISILLLLGLFLWILKILIWEHFGLG